MQIDLILNRFRNAARLVENQEQVDRADKEQRERKNESGEEDRSKFPVVGHDDLHRK